MGPFRVLAVAACLLAAACGASEPETIYIEAPATDAADTPAPTATSAASSAPTTAPTPTPTPEPAPTTTPAPAPEPTPTLMPTPVLTEAQCPGERDKGGSLYSYDPDAVDGEAAMLEHCGTLAPVSGVCPEDRVSAGGLWRYDPDDSTRAAAIASACGPVKPTELSGEQCSRLAELGPVIADYGLSHLDTAADMTDTIYTGNWLRHATTFGEAAESLSISLRVLALEFGEYPDPPIARMARAAREHGELAAWGAGEWYAARSADDLLIIGLYMIEIGEKLYEWAGLVDDVHREFCT